VQVFVFLMRLYCKCDGSRLLLHHADHAATAAASGLSVLTADTDTASVKRGERSGDNDDGLVSVVGGGDAGVVAAASKQRRSLHVPPVVTDTTVRPDLLQPLEVLC